MLNKSQTKGLLIFLRVKIIILIVFFCIFFLFVSKITCFLVFNVLFLHSSSIETQKIANRKLMINKQNVNL